MIRKFTCLLIFLTFHFLSSELHAQGSCASAVMLTPGTQQCGDTSTGGDTFDDNSCLGSYDGGDDYLFVYNATGGEALQLDLTSAGSWTGISISEGCPEAGGGTCAGSSTSSSGNESFTSDALNPGLHYIHISTYPTPQSATFCLDATVTTPPMPPANDDCANATTLACGDNLIGETTVLSTDNGDAAGCAMGVGVWYTFTGNDMDVTVVVDATFDSEISVSSSADCAAFTNVSCRDSGNPETTTFYAASGLKYYIYVGHWSGTGTTTGTFDLSLTCAPPATPPANDDCANATTLACGDNLVGESTVASTDNGDATGCTMGVGIWYTFSGNDMDVTVTADATFDSEISVSSSADCAAFTNVSCTDSGNPESTTFFASSGTDYYIYVGHWSGTGTTTGTFDLSVTCAIPATPPANDDCANAISLTAAADGVCLGTTAGTVEAATPSGESTTCVGTEDDDVWYSFEATNTSHVIDFTNLAGSTTDMAYGVFSGSCGGGLVNEGCTDTNSGLTVSGLTIGMTYYIQVYTYTATSGQTSTFDVCVVSPPPPPANDDCVGAITLPVNGIACGIPTPSGNTSATDSGVANCTGTANDDVWYAFEATASTHVIDLSNIASLSSTDLGHEVFSSDCGTLVSEYCSDPNNSSYSSYIPGNTYYLRVFQWGGTAYGNATFDICITTPPPPASCSDALDFTKFCIDQPIIFPGGVNSGNADVTDPSNDYDCLTNSPNPAWHYIEISGAGDLVIDLSNSNNLDIDWMMWGPYPDFATAQGACGTYTTANQIACDYTTASTGSITAAGVAAGDVFVLLVTNYSNDPTDIVLEAGATNTAITDCSGVCSVPTAIAPQNGGLYTANLECTDNAGWTHYKYDNGTPADVLDDILLLSVKKNGNVIGSIGDPGFSVEVETGAGSIDLSAAPYVSNPNGWYVMDRYWDLTPVMQPTTPVDVRFYYTETDKDDVVGAATGSTFATNHGNLIFYVVHGTNDPNPDNGHSTVADVSATGIELFPGAFAGGYGTDGANAGSYAEMTIGTFSGGGGGSGPPCTNCPVNPGPLPVELAKFDGESQENGNLLSWTTLSEINTIYFQVESSNDGSRFETTGQVFAQGSPSTSTEYSFFDESLNSQMYYRLKMVDEDGAFSYSPVILLIRSKTTFGIHTINPNPVFSEANIQYYVPKSGVIEFTLTDVIGRELKTITTNADAGINQYQMDMHQLSSGVYFITIFSNREQQTIKVIKK